MGLVWAAGRRDDEDGHENETAGLGDDVLDWGRRWGCRWSEFESSCVHGSARAG